MTKNTDKYFYSIKGTRKFETKIKRSRFICSLKFVETINQAKEFISAISNDNKNATHNCWAYILGENGDTNHCSDAGEPSGTAGKPMLNTLKKHKTTKIAAVVTRHFGGVKLGIKGLINAYSESVQKTLQLEKLVKLIETETFSITTDYSFNDKLTYALDKYSGTILNTDYSQSVRYSVEVEKKNSGKLEQYLIGLQNSGILHYLKV